ncbi:hypothetical protein GCM10028778_22470 [Barrientosiimonas marina]|uniref:Uncharacterized protein n=1 Tax=Lentibacillus kimchii TaxID=1542911 RepID=A0ABW2UWC8_9BACI
MIDKEPIRSGNRTQEIHHNPIEGTWVLEEFSDEGERKLPVNGLIFGSSNRDTYTIKENDPLSARVQCEWELKVGRDDWMTTLESYSDMTCDETNFYLTNTMTAYENGSQIFEKTWNKEIPRDHI